jgi:hypothetical protein
MPHVGPVNVASIVGHAHRDAAGGWRHELCRLLTAATAVARGSYLACYAAAGRVERCIDALRRLSRIVGAERRRFRLARARPAIDVVGVSGARARARIADVSGLGGQLSAPLPLATDPVPLVVPPPLIAPVAEPLLDPAPLPHGARGFGGAGAGRDRGVRLHLPRDDEQPRGN